MGGGVPTLARSGGGVPQGRYTPSQVRTGEGVPQGTYPQLGQEGSTPRYLQPGQHGGGVPQGTYPLSLLPGQDGGMGIPRYSPPPPARSG